MPDEKAKEIKDDKGKEIRAMDENSTTNIDRSISRGIVTDALIFFILVIIISLAMIIISSLPKDTDYYYTHYSETDEYIEDSMQTVFSSTAPTVSYTDQFGIETEISSKNMEHLIIIDLDIRNTNTNELNTTSLQEGIEHELSSALTSVYPDTDFVFICAYADDDSKVPDSSTNIYLTNTESSLKPLDGLNPAYERVLTLPESRENGEQNNDIMIRLYLIK
jgi:hypothetical protein